MPTDFSSSSAKLSSLLSGAVEVALTLSGQYTDPRISRLQETLLAASLISSSLTSPAPDPSSELRSEGQRVKLLIGQLQEQKIWYAEAVLKITEWRFLSLTAEKLVGQGARDSSNRAWSEVCVHLLKHPDQPLQGK